MCHSPAPSLLLPPPLPRDLNPLEGQEEPSELGVPFISSVDQMLIDFRPVEVPELILAREELRIDLSDSGIGRVEQLLQFGQRQPRNYTRLDANNLWDRERHHITPLVRWLIKYNHNNKNAASL